MRRIVLSTIAVSTLVATPQPAAAAKAPPKITKLRCVPAAHPGCEKAVRLEVGRKIQFSGKNLYRGMRVTFRWSKGALATRLAKDRTGWTARIPTGTTSGGVWVYVTDKRHKRSNRLRVTVLAPKKVTTPLARPDGSAPGVFAGNGMWVWYLSKTEGGDLDDIAARAKAAGIRTLFIKAADGASAWSQWDSDLVRALHQRGIQACAWQFVYGSDPAGEAAAAAAAIGQGADCFVIDAETHYEGRYAAAETYMTALRAAVGPAYPLGLTSFPYVDYHPKLPYSVFLGPGGAQANLPQVYWKDIGGSVDAVSAKTVATNRVYGAALAPLGQTYGSPSAADLRRFRALWAGYGSTGLSWWSWQATPASGWTTLTESALPGIPSPDPGWPALAKRSKGDLVVALQQRLATFDPTVPIDGTFGTSTDRALKTFQAARGLEASGETDADTWQALLRLDITAASWN
ncbi:MAG: peptidoglycan-binding protein [Solirubrobacteraceae bacterium]|nr:peptidoglycan-binding protein [Solirubrobacteraceae bacterium]